MATDWKQQLAEKFAALAEAAHKQAVFPEGNLQGIVGEDGVERIIRYRVRATGELPPQCERCQLHHSPSVECR